MLNTIFSMIHRCESCPGKESLSEYLKNAFAHFESDDKIVFQQWRTSDRCDLKHIEI